MEEFEYKTLKEQRKMAIEELQLYYNSLIKYEYLSNKEIVFDLKRRIYHIVRLILKIDRLLNHRSLKVIKNRSYNTNDNLIYACTIAGQYDVESVVESINNPAWIIDSNPCITDTRELLIRTGILTIDSQRDELRKESIRDRKIKLLSKKGNIVIFPETSKGKGQVGNLSDEVAELVVESEATIIPVALEESCINGKTQCLVNIGKNLCFRKISPNFIPDITHILKTDLEHLKEETFEYQEKRLLSNKHIKKLPLN